MPGPVPVPPPTSEPPQERPGWGHGDPNHDHTGPPGQEKKKEKGGRP
ncbi:MAG TPA: hypothetical protein VD813_07470 [Pseudonocardia sp.]|nr:hypothetical protein [Pseudonocardia sp.]